MTKEVNKNGIYHVRLFVNGLQTSVVVDDFVPVYKNSRQPAFSRSMNKEIWAIILEKAWAKLHGGYAQSSSGVPSFASIHLTGAPAQSYPHDATTQKTEKGNYKKIKIDPESFWQRFARSQRLNRYIIGNGRPTSEFEGKEINGMVTQHAYPVTKLVEFEHEG